MVEVDPDDPAFREPTKFIGPVYDEAEASRLETQHGWTFKLDGDRWRRVVASPAPVRIFEHRPIEWLIEKGAIVICAGGGAAYRPCTGQTDHARSSAPRSSSTRTAQVRCWRARSRRSSSSWRRMSTACTSNGGTPNARKLERTTPSSSAPSSSPKVRWDKGRGGLRLVERTGRAAIARSRRSGDRRRRAGTDHPTGVTRRAATLLGRCVSSRSACACHPAPPC